MLLQLGLLHFLDSGHFRKVWSDGRQGKTQLLLGSKLRFLSRSFLFVDATTPNAMFAVAKKHRADTVLEGYLSDTFELDDKIFVTVSERQVMA